MGDKSGDLGLTLVPFPDRARQDRQCKPAARSKVQECKLFLEFHDILLVEEKLISSALAVFFGIVGSGLVTCPPVVPRS
jgi:hypothetical protein